MQAGDHNRAEQLQNTTPEGLRFNELRPGQLDYQMHYPEPGDSNVRTKLMTALLTTAVLTISACAQDNNDQHAMIAAAPKHLSASGPQDIKDQYPQQMEAVLQSVSQELVQITQAVRDGSIDRSQAEYLSVERYYVGLMRFQLLRAFYQNADGASQRQPYSQAKTSPQNSDTVVTIAPPTSSPDVQQQLANYLQLNPEQIAAIQAQIANDRKQVQPLLQRLETSRRALISSTLEGQYDAKRVELLAAEQSQIMEQLIVANTMLETELYKLLTPEQQQKVDELRRQAMASVKVNFPEW